MRRLRHRLCAMVAGLAVGVMAMLPAPGAQAAVADVWAFGYLDNAAPPVGYVMDTTRQWGTFKTPCPGDWMTVSLLSAGVYQVSIPCSASPRGIVHVTTVDATGAFCTAGRWVPAGQAEVVYVFCFDAAGVPANTRFTVLFTTSSGLAVAGGHAYVFADPNGALITTYNSTGPANVVNKLAVGRYRVRLPNLSSTDFTGDLQTTAMYPGQTPRRCRVADWARGVTDYVAYVTCTDAAGVHADSYFTLSFHHKRAVFGSLAPPLNIGFVLAGSSSPDTNYNSVNGPNVVTPIAIGLTDVFLPDIGTGQTHMQVTAYSGRPVYCGLSDVWMVVGTDVLAQSVACFEPGGVPAKSQFFATYSSSL